MKAAADGARGRMSLASGLMRSIRIFEATPDYAAREVLLLFASLSNWDPVEMHIDNIISLLEETRVRVSVVALSPEMHILRRICSQTGGTYCVGLDCKHFEKLLVDHVPAPQCGNWEPAPKLVKMGFPKQVFEVAGPAMCSCHLQTRLRLFICPQCHARVCQVPGKCFACQLPLASAPLMARCLRHLNPLPPFVHVPDSRTRVQCCGCHLPGPLPWQCPTCSGHFCESCNAFMHSSLQQCPGCIERTLQSTGA